VSGGRGDLGVARFFPAPRISKGLTTHPDDFLTNKFPDVKVSFIVNQSSHPGVFLSTVL
jgi:hypothetical protein